MATDLYRLIPHPEIPGKHRLEFFPHPGQMEALESTARFVTICAGSQSGKTTMGPLWLWDEIKRMGPGDYLVATPTFPLLALKLLPEFRNFFEDTMNAGRYLQSPTKQFRFSQEGKDRLWGRGAYPRDKVTVFFGTANRPDSLESATAKAAWLDEAGQEGFKLGSYQAIRRRLALAQGRILTTTTPYSAFGWFKTELYDPAVRGDRDYDLVRFESIMNPAFSVDEWNEQRDLLPEWKFNLFYRGILTRPAGMIYDCWDDSFVVDDFVPPPEWKIHVGLDFGGINTAAVFLAENPLDKTLYLFDEYYPQELRTARDHATAIAAIATKKRRGTVVGGSKSEDQWRLEFSDAKFPILRPLVSDVEVGINRTYGIIKSARLRVDRSCEGFIGEVEKYSRKLDDNELPTDDIEEPNRYHHLDALRYLSTHLNQGTPPQRRVVSRTERIFRG